MNEKELGKRLQLARQQAGLTQQELCAKAGLSISTLAKIERGAIKAPSIFTVSVISSVVGVPLEELVGPPTLPSPPKQRSKSGIRFVYFDVNGVLVRFFHRAFVKMAEDTGTAPDIVETAFWHYNYAVCSGELPMEKFNSILAERLKVDEINWEKYYFDNIESIPEMFPVVTWVAEHYQVGLFTDSMPGFLDRLISEGRVPRVDYDAIIDSSKIGTVKPDAKAFAVAQEKAGVPAEEILLVDDGSANIMAADKAGWRILRFDDYSPADGAERVRSVLEF